MALPFCVVYFFYNILGPQSPVTYYTVPAWTLILGVPVWLNYRRKYFFARTWVILASLLGFMMVFLIHGVKIRLEANFLLLMLCS